MKKNLLAAFLFLALSATSFATVSIISVRNQFAGTPIVLAPGTVIAGTVISDLVGNNTSSLNVFIQDASGGICVRFTSPHTFAMGDSISIDLSNDTLSDYNGLVQVTRVLLSGATNLGTGTIIPALVTVADILSNMSGTTDTWESTLVTISNATIIAPTGTYLGNDTIVDATGSLIIYTRSAATFSASVPPSGLVNITGIVSDFNVPELFIRNLGDVVLANAINETVTATTNYAVYPNPVHGFIQVKALNNAGTESNFTITDASGRVLKSGLLSFGSAKNATVDVNDLSLGMYILSVEGKNSTQQIKVVMR